MQSHTSKEKEKNYGNKLDIITGISKDHRRNR